MSTQATDLEELRAAEKKLLEAVKAASEVTSKLSAGQTKDLEGLCAQFLDNIQDSQVSLVRLAAKYAEPLPYEGSDFSARLEVEAARQRLEAAEAQLAVLQLQLQQGQQQGR